MNGRLLAIGLVAALVTASAAGCGEDAGDTLSTAPPAGAGDEVRYEGSFTVLESPDHGPELCAFVATSLPPQCGGLPITNWDWGAVDGETSRNGTTWGSWHVVGTYAEGELTLTEPPGPPQPGVGGASDFSPACDEPDVVDPDAGEEDWMVATEDLSLDRIDGLVAIWVSGSGRTDEDFVVNVIVRPASAAAATDAIRTRYAGRLCVVERDLPTEDELRKVQDEVMDEAARAVIGQVQTAAADPQRGAVIAQVWVVDDAAERYARERWGDHVILDPLLKRVPPS